MSVCDSASVDVERDGTTDCGCNENEDRRPKTRKRTSPKIASKHPKRKTPPPPPFFPLFYLIRTPIHRRLNAAIYTDVFILSTIKGPTYFVLSRYAPSEERWVTTFDPADARVKIQHPANLKAGPSAILT